MNFAGLSGKTRRGCTRKTKNAGKHKNENTDNETIRDRNQHSRAPRPRRDPSNGRMGVIQGVRLLAFPDGVTRILSHDTRLSFFHWPANRGDWLATGGNTWRECPAENKRQV